MHDSTLSENIDNDVASREIHDTRGSLPSLQKTIIKINVESLSIFYCTNKYKRITNSSLYIIEVL